MTNPHAWSVDLSAGTASCEAYVLSFSPYVDGSLSARFLSDPGCEAEALCRLAGEALDAVCETHWGLLTRAWY